MTTQRDVFLYEKDALAASVAERFIATVLEVLDREEEAHVVLTGGSMGIAVLAAINVSPSRDRVDWSRIHAWWGDERWVPSGHPDRNDQQAAEALLNHVAIPDDNLHRFPAAAAGLSLDEGAAWYEAELKAHAGAGSAHPEFAITFLGIGPDGHIASLFPHHPGIDVEDATVIAVRESPKPPPERLSLTRPVLNASERVWLVVAGADKASALGQAFAGATRDEIPVGSIQGERETVFFVDHDAAAEIPQDLLARNP